MKLVFASPTYGPIEPEVAIGQRLAIMHARKHGGVDWVGDCSPHDVKQSTIDQARNRVVKEVLQTPADGIFWCDSDIILPPETITELVLYQKDFICGIYCQRRAPYFPVITHYDPDGVKTPAGNMNWFVEWPENAIAPIDACGFGCVLTSTAMLRKIGAPWFAFGDFSEDFAFCLKAKQAGFQLFVNTAIQCEHVGERERVSVETFRRNWKGGAQPADDADSAA